MSASYTCFLKSPPSINDARLHVGAGVSPWLAKASFGWPGGAVRPLEAERLDENMSRTSQRHLRGSGCTSTPRRFFPRLAKPNTT
jgi:hypothetical protein